MGFEMSSVRRTAPRLLILPVTERAAARELPLPGKRATGDGAVNVTQTCPIIFLLWCGFIYYFSFFCTLSCSKTSDYIFFLKTGILFMCDGAYMHIL